MSGVALTRRCVLFGWKHVVKTRSNNYNCHLYLYNNRHCYKSLSNSNQIYHGHVNFVKNYSTKQTSDVEPLKPDEDKSSEKDKNKKSEEEVKKVGLFKKFKQMYRDYWYVLIPVHVATSTCWAGLFYYVAKSGVDVIAILESIKVSPALIDNVRDSNMGYIALTYALYKIATPARYAVTLAGTTISINYLKRWGYLRPVPSREKLKDMYNEKKGALQEKYQEGKDGFQEIYQAKREVLKNKKKNLWEDIVKRNQNGK